MWRAEDLRARTRPPRARAGRLGILLLLVSLSTARLSGQAAQAPKLTFPRSENVSLSPQRPPQVSLTIRCENSAIDLVLADPENRRLGNDPPHHQAYDEIPGAYLDSRGPEDEETGAQEDDPAQGMNLVNPRPGGYRLSLIGARDGTYSCVISARLENGARAQIRLRNRPLRGGEVQQVDFTFAPESNSFLVPGDAALIRP